MNIKEGMYMHHGVNNINCLIYLSVIILKTC